MENVTHADNIFNNNNKLKGDNFLVPCDEKMHYFTLSHCLFACFLFSF